MKSVLHRFAEGYKRLRHTRGYGVHSPFAYRIVQGVFNLPADYGYYGEEDLRLSPRGSHDRIHIKESTRLLRLAAQLRIESAYLPPDTAACYRNALRLAKSDMHITSVASEAMECELICTHGDQMPLETLCTIVQSPLCKAVIMHHAPENWETKLFDALKEGVIFIGLRNAVVIPRAGMQKIAYTVNI